MSMLSFASLDISVATVVQSTVVQETVSGSKRTQYCDYLERFFKLQEVSKSESFAAFGSTEKITNTGFHSDY